MTPTFASPDPVSARIDIVSGDVTLVGWDQSTTEVTIQPASDRGGDVRAAEQTVVQYDEGRLLIRQGPDRPARWSWTGSIRLVVSLPARSSAEVTTREGDLTSRGQLGDLRVKTGDGDIVLADTEGCQARTADGDVRIGRVGGDLAASTADGDIEVAAVSGQATLDSGDGQVRVGSVAGPLTLRTGDGDVRVGSLAGGGHVRTADGDISIAACTGPLDAVTADGDLRVGCTHEGTVRLSTSNGDIVVGIARGTSAWLDLDTADGRVINDLADVAGPVVGHGIVRVHARSGSGDIVVGRDEPEEIQDRVPSRPSVSWPAN